MLLYNRTRVTLALSSALYRFSLLPILWDELKTNGREVKGDTLKEIKQKAECQSNKRVRVEEEGGVLVRQCIKPVKQCMRPDFCDICISLCEAEFIKEFSREMGRKGSIVFSPSKSAIILNQPFFSLRIPHCCPFQMEMWPETHFFWLVMEMYSWIFNISYCVPQAHTSSALQ